jgi:undecaprenyl-diphosphatase
LSIIQAVIYGAVQGITEFLPISSTAHLKLLPWFMGWNEPGTAFDVALHAGTAIAVIIFFFADWVRLISAGLARPKSSEGKLFWYIVIATIPGAIAGITLDKYMDAFSNPFLTAVMLIVMGIVLLAADKTGKRETEFEKIGLKRSIIIGISQALAIIPGVSRSGITMTTGRFLGMTREGIAKFTFLMATPIIVADALYHAKGLAETKMDMAPFLTAVVTAAIVGILSIRFLLDFIKKRGFTVFAVYRFLLGALVIFVYFMR